MQNTLPPQSALKRGGENKGVYSGGGGEGNAQRGVEEFQVWT